MGEGRPEEGSFGAGFIARQPISQRLLQTVRLIGEYKGKQALFAGQSPQVLETLRQVSVIQSIESSNRIEGVTAAPNRLKELVADKTTPRDRSEQEIAGYREVLKTIHQSAQDIPLKTRVVLQLHRDLYKFLPAGMGGRWKASDNSITETDAVGHTRVRFKPVAAHRTPAAMDALHEGFAHLRDEGEVEPILLIAAYVLDFLCIHPFPDGNGRMARLLALLLLYQSGYEVGRYISLEQIIERTREGYYEALYKSSQGWHEGTHTLIPWWEYFTGVMLLTAYRDFEQRVGAIVRKRGAKGDIVKDVIARLPMRFQLADVERGCPGVARSTIQRIMVALRDEGSIRCIKAGRDALWEKTAGTL
ncbi:Fic family protein [Hyalangium rubrum]|uniref:Fic family protein n=1 Tax=Hyalangium rubrum TaxID=3103134 RepID=A0ABU5GYY5_9BACT|nr:Fic family protein [Hyalangium sp. s54d21]MDY7226416.1 Fic family protein [Hyalangium sp. s54d21]